MLDALPASAICHRQHPVPPADVSILSNLSQKTQKPSEPESQRHRKHVRSHCRPHIRLKKRAWCVQGHFFQFPWVKTGKKKIHSSEEKTWRRHDWKKSISLKKVEINAEGVEKGGHVYFQLWSELNVQFLKCNVKNTRIYILGATRAEKLRSMVITSTHLLRVG